MTIQDRLTSIEARLAAIEALLGIRPAAAAPETGVARDADLEVDNQSISPAFRAEAEAWTAGQREAAAARDKRAAAALAALRAEGWIPRASDAPDDAAGAPGQ